MWCLWILNRSCSNSNNANTQSVKVLNNCHIPSFTLWLLWILNRSCSNNNNNNAKRLRWTGLLSVTEILRSGFAIWLLSIHNDSNNAKRLCRTGLLSVTEILHSEFAIWLLWILNDSYSAKRLCRTGLLSVTEILCSEFAIWLLWILNSSNNARRKQPLRPAQHKTFEPTDPLSSSFTRNNLCPCISKDWWRDLATNQIAPKLAKTPEGPK